ncbi:MAG: bromoperoxidase [Pseudomonadota bacterium]
MISDDPIRRGESTARRVKAAETAALRPPMGPVDNNNGEKLEIPAVTSFHKGLLHDANGMPYHREEDGTPIGTPPPSPNDPVYFEDLVDNLDRDKAQNGAYFKFELVMAPDSRALESPLAGFQYDLQGPDAGAVSIAAAPRVGSDELVAEMAEVYALAVIRDVPFADWHKDPSIRSDLSLGITFKDVVSEINALSYYRYPPTAKSPGGMRHLGRKIGKGVTAKTIFRGSGPDVEAGPYISQFMLIGSADRTTKGRVAAGVTSGTVRFGANRIDQRVKAHAACIDWMTNWDDWLAVQNGANEGGKDEYEADLRFIQTPRDLATYVHFDELYQAYFTAALLMTAYGVPFDHGFPSGPWHKARGSFATFGGPHLLSLLTEVASRGLRAVRRQKFQSHLRGRPEQLAAMMTLAGTSKSSALGWAENGLKHMARDMEGLGSGKILSAINAINKASKTKGAGSGGSGTPKIPAGKNYLLPMAFPEGSPMHAAYGAGHATVAGACVTVLKAFFETSDFPGSDPKTNKPKDIPKSFERLLTLDQITSASTKSVLWRPRPYIGALEGVTRAYEAVDLPRKSKSAKVKFGGPNRLSPISTAEAARMTLDGELNKLAANISIGRNMAGVHYYSDYYDSLRLGERIAVGIMEEQMHTYTDPVTMRLTSFDGDRVVIYREPDGDVGVMVAVPGGGFLPAGNWWTRHQIHQANYLVAEARP